MVKKKLVIAVLSLYLLASTEVHQVLRLPLLVRHYVEHREQVNDMTFWEFLVMHYKTDVPHDDQDTSLPFKECHHSGTAQLTAMPSPNISLALPVSSSTRQLSFFNQSQVHSSYLEEIFQPPRFS